MTTRMYPPERSQTLRPAVTFVVIILIVVNFPEQIENALLFPLLDILIEGSIDCLFLSPVLSHFLRFPQKPVVDSQVRWHNGSMCNIIHIMMCEIGIDHRGASGR